MQCPYCLTMVVDLIDECPRCEASLPVDYELEVEVNAHFDDNEPLADSWEQFMDRLEDDIPV